MRTQLSHAMNAQMRFWANATLAMLLLAAGGQSSVWAQTDVTGYETVTITIPATDYDASGAPQMARVKYNKTFPLIITSDDMGKTELTNNWAEVNGYPNINNTTDIGIQPGGTLFLQAPYKRYYMQGESSDVSDYAPMTYTDNVGKTQRYRMTSAIMPYLLKSDGTSAYSYIDANDAKLMLRTGWSFAQHDVNDISSVTNISTAMTNNSTIWANKVGIGLKVMVEPNGNHDYLDAGCANSGICWNIFQNNTTTYPFQSKTLATWAATRSDWTENGRQSDATNFTNTPAGGYQRSFFQGHETEWKNEVNNADGTSLVIGGTHGLGDDIKDHLRTATNVKNNAWVGSADEVWEYYHIYNNLVIENVSWDETNKKLTFDVKVPTYKKNQYRELTLNIPGLTGGSTPTFTGASVITGGYRADGGSGIGYTMNIGLESSITTYIDQLMAIYRDDQTNEFVKRDIEYLISQLWDGSSYTTQLNASPTHDLTVQSSLGTTLATIKTDTDGDKSFAVPRYIVSGDKLYEVAANGSRPHYAQTITTTTTPSAVSYTEKSLSSLQVNDYTPKAKLFVEGEDMDGMTILGADLDLPQSSSGRYWAMALGSGGMAGNLVSGTTVTVTSALLRGKYKAVIGYGETYKSQGTYNYNLLVDGTQVATVSTSSATNNAVTELTTAEFEISADGQAITLTTDNTNTGSRWIDYIYFVQTRSLEPQVPTATLTSNISSSIKVNKTAILTATTGLNGGTLTSTAIYAATSAGTKTGDALASSTTEATTTYSFTPTATGTYYFVSESVNSVGTTTSSLLTITVVESIDTYTLSIVDKSGNIALTTTVSSASLTTDPLPDAYRSPFANNYKYYNTVAEAQANSGSNLTAVTDWAQETNYVGYDVDATKMAAGKVHAIWANNIWMHIVVHEGNAANSQSKSHNGFVADNQKYDVVNKKGTTVQNSNLTVPNLPIVDNTYMWDLGTDPYNIKLKNKALGFYNSPNTSSVNAVLYDGSEESSANAYCLTYWQNRAGTADTSASYYRLVKRTDGRTVGSNGASDGSWRAYLTSDLSDNDWNAVTKLYVHELPKVNINILDDQNEVECILQGYYNTNATTMPQNPTGSYTPYTLSRAYTSLHKWYYSYTSESVNDPVVYGSVLDFSKLSSDANLYVKYTLDTSKWGTVVKTADTNIINPFTSTGTSYDWYSIKIQNLNKYLLANESSAYPVTVDETGTAPTEATTLGQWAFTGTPYNVKLINRYYGEDTFLGITKSSDNHDSPKLYLSGTEDVNFSFEAVNNIGDNATRLLLRPKGVFNGDYPYLYLGSNYSPTNAAYEDNAGANSRLVLNWIATTDIIRPSTVHLEVNNSTPYVDNAVTLTATVTPDNKDRNVISSFAIEQQVNGEWTQVGTAYSGSNVEGATKNDETGVVTVTYAFTPTAEGTFNFRAHAVVDGESQYSTADATAGGDGDVVEIIATVKPLTPYNSTYTLTLIDKAGNELLTEASVPASRITETNTLSGRNGDPFDNAYRSPLVTTYKYYEGTTEGKASAQAADDDNLVDWNTYTGTTIYVGYTVSDAIDLNATAFSSLSDLMTTRVKRSETDATRVRNADSFGKMYMLKFKTSAAYNLEDGSDNRNATATPANTLIYPYTNGDGPIYMYSHQRYLDQKDNGASTRTRWPWFLVSPKGDPYHVYITSWQNSHADGGTNYYSYLRTYYNSTIRQVVTNNVTDSIISGNAVMPTDYMILRGSGTDGLNYKLMTSSVVDDGDNATTDTRQTVTSFEQYWRTNPTAQRYFGITAGSADLTSAQETTLEGLGWHKYAHYAKATTATSSTKTYENANHWFMTVSLGDGSLDLVETNIDGVLVLLDNHGWEIMRQPIVERDDPDYSTVQAALRKYDSPMVKNYKFYKSRGVDHKVSGYHKYNINNGANKALTESARVNGSTTYTSLADYPESMQGGALTDLYVTYDVADDYASSYIGAATEAGTSASSFLLRQGSNYAKADDYSITSTATVAEADRWKLKPNFNIDAEMGYVYDVDVNGLTTGAILNEAATNEGYVTYGKAGFDPYNLQIQNATTSTYFTTNATTAALSSGAWTGNGSTLSLAAVSSHITPTGYDNKTLAVTNATFMAVKDSYGNMRLMPRFQHEQVVDNFSALADPATLTAYDATNTQTTQLTTPVTYHIIDNSGNDALQMTVTDGIGLSLPDALKSPMVSAYQYHSTQAHASDASTRATGDLTVAQPDVYVSYTVDATKMTATKKYAISNGASNVFLHRVFRGNQATSSILEYRYRLDHQIYDQENSGSPSPAPNQLNHSNLPIVDNTYLWTLGDDPYNIVITSAVDDTYKYVGRDAGSGKNGQLLQANSTSNAVKYCLLYWNGDPTTNYSVLRYSSANTSLTTETYVQYNSNNDGRWVDASANSEANAKLLIEELPEVNVNVVNAAGTVEYTLVGRYISTATVPATTTVPFFLQRLYTSGHTYYYNAACDDQMTAGSAPDATKMESGKTDGKYNIYVRYDLDSDWDTENLFKVSTAGAKEYYILNYIGNSTTPFIGVNASMELIGKNASTTDDTHWALYGTPYALRLENQANEDYYIGIPTTAVYNTKPKIYNSFDGIISTWELSAYTNNGVSAAYKTLPFIRPQGSISRETPLLYLRPKGTDAALADVDANINRVTFEAAAKVTLVVVDKDGREVLSEQVSDATVISTSGDPLSAELRSPYAKNYQYYATAEEAKANEGTTLDETAILAKVEGTVYVGYDINAADGETILHTDGTAYRIRRNPNNSEVMHAVFQPSNTGSSDNNYGWKMENQARDYDDGSSNLVNYNTLPFIDRSWAWEFVNSNGDPYSVKIRNKATGQYLRCENNVNKQYQAMFTDNESEAALFSLLQYASSTAYLAIYVTDNNVSQTGYLYYNANADGGTWRLRSTRTSATGSNDGLANIRVKELTTPLDIHIVAPANAPNAGEVEATLHGYRNSGVGANTVPSFVPYFLTRAYTSDQKFYYTQEAAADPTNNTEISTVDDNSITDSYGSDGILDVFVAYTLDSNSWIGVDTELSSGAKTANTTIIKPFYSSERKINWYGIRTSEDNSNFLKADGTLPAAITRNSLDTSAADGDAMKQSEWAIIGTPYNLQLVERYHGMSSHLGVAGDAVNGSRAYVYASGTENVVTSFELLTGLANTTGKLFLRPQGSLNGQAPYVYVGGSSDNMLLSKAAGKNQIIDLTWIKETEAKTLTFKLYDTSGRYMAEAANGSIADNIQTGYQEGDALDVIFSGTGMMRRFCNYAFYSDSGLTTEVSVVGSDDEQTFYVKWGYTDDAPVFSTGENPAEYQYYDLKEKDYLYASTEDGVIQLNTSDVSDQGTHWAFIGNPYSLKLYNRAVGQFLTASEYAIREQMTTNATGIDWDLPIISSSAQSNEVGFRAKGHTVYLREGGKLGYPLSMSIAHIFLPLTVYDNEMNVKDAHEYRASYPTPIVADGTKIIGDKLMRGLYGLSTNGLNNPNSPNLKHGFCDYTYYNIYASGTPATLSEEIPSEGLSIFGGAEQKRKVLYATYTVDEEQFGQAWLMGLQSSENHHYYGKAAETTDQTSQVFNNVAAAREENSWRFRWQFVGDPYNFKVMNLSLPEYPASYLGSKTSVGVDETSSINMYLSSYIGAGTQTADESETKTYPNPFNTWELIDNGDGTYYFWYCDENNRYDKGISAHTGTVSSLYVKQPWHSLTQTYRLASITLDPVVEQFNITWQIVREDGTTYTTDDVAPFSSTTLPSVMNKNITKGTVLTIADLPDELRRHYCEYKTMLEEENGSYAEISSYTVAEAKTLYVVYTLEDGAPTFNATLTPDVSVNAPWSEIRYPSSNAYVYAEDGVLKYKHNPDKQERDNKYRWALIGSPYNLQLYNRSTETYATVSGTVQGDAFPLASTGTTFELLDDYTGDLTAIHQKADGSRVYINRQVKVFLRNNSVWTQAEFVGNDGLDGLVFCLHYSGKTLRPGKANGTERIVVNTYQAKNRDLLKVMPDKWKRAYCDYTFKWNTDTDIDEEWPSSGRGDAATTEVTKITADMVNAKNGYNTNGLYNKAITIDIYYDYDKYYDENGIIVEHPNQSPFHWNDQANIGDKPVSQQDATKSYWYHVVNSHHMTSSVRDIGYQSGRMMHQSGENTLRVDAEFDAKSFYTVNTMWCFIGDPYGFRMLNFYDPDHLYREYLAVDAAPSSDVYGTATFFRPANGREGSSTPSAYNPRNLFEMRLGSQYYVDKKTFWFHPIYEDIRTYTYTDENDVTQTATTSMIDEPEESISYLTVRATDTSAKPILVNAEVSSPKGTSVANYRVEELTYNMLEEYLYYAGFVGALKWENANSTDPISLGGDETTTMKDIRDKIVAARATNKRGWEKYRTATDGYETVINAQEAHAIHEAIADWDNRLLMKRGYYRIIPYVSEKGVQNNGLNKDVERVYFQKYWNASTSSMYKAEPLADATYDPASIFWFEDTGETVDNKTDCPRWFVRTQGLNLSGSALTADGVPFKCRYENLGGCLAQLKVDSNTDDYRYNYLASVQDWQPGVVLRNTFEMYGETRLYFQPVGDEDENLLPFKLKMNQGHPQTSSSSLAKENGPRKIGGLHDLDNLPYTYTSLYVPFDVKIKSGKSVSWTSGDDDLTAAQCDAVPFVGKMERYHDKLSEAELHDGDYYNKDEYTLVSYSVDVYTEGKEAFGTYAGDKQFVPAGTPVIFRSLSGMQEVTFDIPNDQSQDYTYALQPNNGSSESVDYSYALAGTDYATGAGGNFVNRLNGSYQTLEDGMTYDVPYYDAATGQNATVSSDADNIYIFGKESKMVNGVATRTGRVGLFPRQGYSSLTHNKIYYVSPYEGGGASTGTAKERIMFEFDMAGFDPVDIEDATTDADSRRVRTDDGVYDLSGRRVGDASVLQNGVTRLPKGVYIVGGRKVIVR